MKVNIAIDTDAVAYHLEENGGTYVNMVTGEVDGQLQDVVNSVIANLAFEFDREDAELGQVLQFPGVAR